MEEDGAVTVANPCVSGGALEIFLQPRRPAPRVVVVGDTPVAHALVALAEPVGFAAEVGEVRLRPGRTTPGWWSPRTGAGSSRRWRRRCAPACRTWRWSAAGSGRRPCWPRLDVPDADRARVRSPAGLDIGARSAGEIALSILAELVAERARPRAPPRRPPPPSRRHAAHAGRSRGILR